MEGLTPPTLHPNTHNLPEQWEQRGALQQRLSSRRERVNRQRAEMEALLHLQLERARGPGGVWPGGGLGDHRAATEARLRWRGRSGFHVEARVRSRTR